MVFIIRKLPFIFGLQISVGIMSDNIIPYSFSKCKTNVRDFTFFLTERKIRMYVLVF